MPRNFFERVPAYVGVSVSERCCLCVVASVSACTRVRLTTRGRKADNFLSAEGSKHIVNKCESVRVSV